MNSKIITLATLFSFFILIGWLYADEPKVGQLEIVAELQINPGNLSVTREGRIFATVHQFRRESVQLIEITGLNTYEPWPNARWNGAFASGPDVFNSLLGIQIDRKNRLWVIDNGLGEPNQQPKLLAFDIDGKQLVFRHDFPEAVGPKGSFLQDLAVDDINDFVYIADVGAESNNPAIIVVDVQNNTSRRFEGEESLNAEDVDLIVDGKVISVSQSDGETQPMRVPINPITISENGEDLYYGAMNGETWYRIPTKMFREGWKDEDIKRYIYAIGEKPVSDGASSDVEGNHFFTDLNNNAITKLDVLKELSYVVQDERIVWPDALSFGEESWLYFAVNQLNRSARLNDGVEKGQPPYYIMKVWTGTQGIPGR